MEQKCDEVHGLVAREVEVEILKHYIKTKAAKSTTLDSLIWQVITAALAIGSAASKLAQVGYTLEALQLHWV